MVGYAERLLEIKRKFLGEIDGRMDAIDRLLDDPDAAGARQDLHLRIHDVTGSAAMLGYDDISREARAGIVELKKLGDETTPMPADCIAALRALAARIRELKTIHEDAL